MPMRQTTIIFHTNQEKQFSLDCDIAWTRDEKRLGLMHRNSLGKNRGMLFAFRYPCIHYVHMNHVSFPLDIIFISSKYRINKYVEASVKQKWKPSFFYLGTGKYIVECHQGFCKKHGILPGCIVEIDSFL